MPVNETLEEMLSGSCHYGDGVYHYDDKVFGFENASGDALDGWGTSRPAITTLDPFCGRRSLYVSNQIMYHTVNHCALYVI